MLVLYVQGAKGEKLPLQLDADNMRLTIAGEPCRLTEQEFQLQYGAL